MRLLNLSRRANVAIVALLMLGILCTSTSATACPFCTAVQQTLRQEMAAMDAVVIAEATSESKRDEETGEVPLKVVSVLKGEEFIKPGTTIRSVYYGGVEAGRRFMLSGVEPKKLLWSSPLPVDERVEDYLAVVMKLPKDDEQERLRFYQEYLQDESTMLARDAYDEFAIAPYQAILDLKDEMDHDQLVQWVKDPEMPADRRRLYLVMLSACGDKQDAAMLQTMLQSTQPSARAGLDALVGCYLTLAGEEGLKTVNELFLANKQAPYADTYAAIMAIRFHGTETDVIPRSELVKALHNVLNRPDLADLVIPDLARWGDWTQIDRLVELYEQADANNNWIRVPVVNYMRACPLPAAKAAMDKLKEIDPDAVKRANTFFSAPVPPPDKSSETSAIVPLDAAAVAAADQVSSDQDAAPARQLSSARGQLLADAAGRGSVAGVAPLTAVAAPNQFRLLGVVGTAALTLLIMGFLVISGGPQPRVEMVPVKTRR